MKKLENRFSDEKIEENKEFIKCDHKECHDYGTNALCYFNEYYNCYMYMKDRIKF